MIPPAPLQTESGAVVVHPLAAPSEEAPNGPSCSFLVEASSGQLVNDASKLSRCSQLFSIGPKFSDSQTPSKGAQFDSQGQERRRSELTNGRSPDGLPRRGRTGVAGARFTSCEPPLHLWKKQAQPGSKTSNQAPKRAAP
ncbi:unnamed protein product [Prorocentrum cordatum]|uniref:Uncharacterized protein n=1 Tax=Prorocentrum cordatum TaxID=2364126 RepID=A0ABN9VID7_9DINO|nr:unnamed protein product [Polarella glacialis]